MAGASHSRCRRRAETSIRSPTAAAARAAVIVGNGLARSPAGCVGSVMKFDAPTNRPVTLLGLKTAKVETTLPPAGVLPAMSRIALVPVPSRVSWYRPLVSAGWW